MLSHYFCIPLLKPFHTSLFFLVLFCFILVWFAVSLFLVVWFGLGFLVDLLLFFFLFVVAVCLFGWLFNSFRSSHHAGLYVILVPSLAEWVD